MQYTLKQACDEISTSTHAYDTFDPAKAVNKAIQALSGMAGWECLRKVVRILSDSPEITLPQGCAGLVRACVNGRPTSIRGQDFQFMHSGPGDLSRPPHGYSMIPNANLVDMGFFPTMVDPPGPFTLFAFSSADENPPLVVRARTTSGDVRRIVVPVYKDPEYDEYGNLLTGSYDAETAEPNPCFLEGVLEVAVDPEAQHQVRLWCDCDGMRMQLAVYHPDVKAPTFRRYMLQNACGPVDVLAEVRIDPLPLREPSDVLPFDSLEPIEWMIQASWFTKSGEVDAAQKYHALAANWLKAREAVNDTVQTPVVVNGLFDMSAGEVSADAYNI